MNDPLNTYLSAHSVDEEFYWPTDADEAALWAVLRGKAGDRKMRLFAAACLRAADCPWAGRWLAVLEAVEHVADGTLTPHDLESALGAAWDVQGRFGIGPESPTGPELDAYMQRWHMAETITLAASVFEGGELFEQLAHAVGRLCEPWVSVPAAREHFGHLFRPVTLDPEWLTSTVVALARGIYADRAFDRMPHLADAMQDAGCEHPDILAHCRSHGPHVRGCWVVDMLTGRA